MRHSTSLCFRAVPNGAGHEKRRSNQGNRWSRTSESWRAAVTPSGINGPDWSLWKCHVARCRYLQ
jgi:hypothetical protein